jgi:FKBP12-rapamycin complex-associated protein
LTWYKTCYDATEAGLVAMDVPDASGRHLLQREDRVHGSLLVLAELLRCSHAEWERVNRELVEIL